MTDRPLVGIGVLVTRPAHQAGPLIDAIERAGGTALPFPVMDIVPRDPEEIARELDDIGRPDLVIFVSVNAVNHGRQAVAEPRPRVAAIGPATAASLGEAGIDIDIRSPDGFNSEQLLALPEMQDVSGLEIIIVRGDGGRALLGDTLRRRGASVTYLPVYARKPHRFSRSEIAAVCRGLANGEIQAAIIMSVETLDLLLDVLPESAIEHLAGTQLVAPGSRVLKTLEVRLPGAECIQAPGPGAREMVAALIGSRGNGNRF